MKLEPTGTCFEDVTQEFIRLLTEDRRRFVNGTLFMIHGICLMEDGEPYSHAWIELDGQVNFPCIADGQKGFAVTTRAEFARVFRVQESTRYTPMECRAMAIKVGDMPPPWESKYRRLCRGALIERMRGVG